MIRVDRHMKKNRPIKEITSTAALCVVVSALAGGGTIVALAQECAAAEGAPGAGARVEPLVPDRPDFTDGVLIVGRGRPQVEAGITFTRIGSARETSLGEALVRVALSERAELHVGVPSYLRARDEFESASGFDNSFLGTKLLLSPGGDGAIGIALLAGATLPTGSRRVAERGGLQPEIRLALAKELSERVELGVNLGYARELDGGQRFNDFFASASLGISFVERLGGFFEIFARSKVNAAGDDARYVAAGLSYLVNPDLMLDVRVGRGLGNDFGSPDYFAGAGASLRF
jgi:hypothetical protein